MYEAPTYHTSTKHMVPVPMIPHLLVLFAGPATAMHHPREVRLDPRSPRKAEPPTKVVVLACEGAQLWVVRLENNDFSVRKLRQKAPATHEGTAEFGGHLEFCVMSGIVAYLTRNLLRSMV